MEAKPLFKILYRMLWLAFDAGMRAQEASTDTRSIGLEFDLKRNRAKAIERIFEQYWL